MLWNTLLSLYQASTMPGRKPCFTIVIFIILFITGYNCSTKPLQKEGSAAQLGQYLFFDNRLSYNHTKSCASCHDPKFAFTDGYRRSITASGDNVLHNSPSLFNSAFLHYFDWANPGITSLEKQHDRPLFNEHPIELGAKGNELAIIAALKKDSLYQSLFPAAFSMSNDPFTFLNIKKAIAAFISTLKSVNAPYDKFMTGDSNALSASAKQGMQLFFSSTLKCGSCHTPPYFTMATQTKNPDSIYLNTGLYNVLNKNKYPAEDNGLVAIRGNVADDGKFKIPSLRNVALTAPYMHDGSINSIEEVIDVYANAGRNITTGSYPGNGQTNLYKDKRINGFIISAAEKKQLIDFLYSLTDTSAIANPAFQDPFNHTGK